MRRKLQRGYVFLGYHLDGMSWDRYLQLTHTERWTLHDELADLLARNEDSSEIPARPKSWRRR